MANIKNYLTNIKSAIFGREVRNSIHDAIEAINNESVNRLAEQDNQISNNTVKQNMLENKYNEQIKELANEAPQLPEIVDARRGFETLGKAIKQKVYYFSNIEQMKMCMALESGDVCKTLGYYEENDGGAGDYKIILDNSLTVNNGNVIGLRNGNKATLIHGTTVNILQFGAKEGTDCKDIIQTAINYVSTFHGILEFPKEKLFYAYDIKIPEGITIDGNDCTIKKPNLSIEPYNFTVNQMKWTRLFQTILDRNIDTPSKLTTLKNIKFDGNALSMWQPSDGYSQEQASLILAGNPSNCTGYEGRFRINIENCTFENNVSDGIHIRENMESNIINCKSKNCFRGGLTLTGGNSIVNVDNFIFRTDIEGMPDGIDVEIDGMGYENSNNLMLNMNNIDIDYDFDIGGCGVNGFININNIKLNKGKFFVQSGRHYGPINITNGYFKETREDENFVIRSIYQDHSITFTNCIFEGSEKLEEIEGSETYEKTSTNKLFIASIYEDSENIEGDEIVTLDNCIFKKILGIGGNLSHVKVINILNCIFTKTVYDVAIGIPNGNIAFAPKILNVNNCIFYNKTKWLQCMSSISYTPNTIIYLSNNKILNSENEGMRFQNPFIYFNNEVYENGFKIALGNGAQPKYRGHRTICGDTLIEQDTSQNYRFINEVDEFQLNDHSNNYIRHEGNWIAKN